MVKKQSNEQLQLQIDELTADLQRMRADFENYRKRVEAEKLSARQDGEARAILKLLPVIDTIERAIVHIPADIAEHKWVKGVSGLSKQLEKIIADLHLEKINSNKGVNFDPEIHQAIQFDEDANGENDVVDEELQAGYKLNGSPIRHAMVKVTKQ